MDNDRFLKRDKLFKSIINNYVLNREIFLYVQLIHKQYKYTTSKWSSLKDDIVLLSEYRYYEYIFDHFKRHNYTLGVTYHKRPTLKKIHIVLNSLVKLNRVKELRQFITLLLELYNDINLNVSHLQLLQILSIAASYGSMDTILYIGELVDLKKLADTPHINKAFEQAPKSGNLEIVKFLFDLVRSEQCIKEAIKTAVQYDHLEIFNWLKSCLVINKNLLSGVNDAQSIQFYGSSCEVLKQLHRDGVDLVHFFNFTSLVYTGRMDIIRWILEEKVVVKPKSVLLNQYIDRDQGSQQRFMEIVCYLIDNHSIPIQTHHWVISPLISSVEQLDWLYDCKNRGFIKFDRLTIDKFVEHSSLKLIQRLHREPSTHCSYQSLISPILRKKLKLLNWLLDNRTDVSPEKAIDIAASLNNFELVMWLHQNRSDGCTHAAMDHAAYNQNFEMVKWFHNNRTEGCTTNAMDYAARYNQWEMVKWLHENRTEGCSEYAFEYVMKEGHLEMLNWLLDNVRSLEVSNHQFLFAIRINNLELFKLLLSRKSTDYITYEIDKWFTNSVKSRATDIIRFFIIDYHYNITTGQRCELFNDLFFTNDLETLRIMDEHFKLSDEIMYDILNGNTSISKFDTLDYLTNTRKDLKLPPQLLIHNIKAGNYIFVAWVLEYHLFRCNWDEMKNSLKTKKDKNDPTYIIQSFKIKHFNQKVYDLIPNK